MAHATMNPMPFLGGLERMSLCILDTSSATGAGALLYSCNGNCTSADRPPASVARTTIGTVSLRSAGSLLILDFDLVAVDPIEIEANYDDKTMWFNGFAQLESNGTAISADAGRVMVRMNGKRRYAVYLQNEERRETTVNLRFMVDGKVVREASLDYAPAR